ncbi:helix-turn-helix transcriptional regulator [Ruminococcus sp.]|uniref:helix-turn-helix domain-containing protein n=1 Tax=Ruminococcus sp. TaxID=41978 RepID=UPI0025D3E81B|nr:helix-turn-helix transcriptional regulator [Ruminococcus sp.]MBQ8965440.1 helix-turn-helix transcriptional regulator [Ruminococcus sp.]
MAKDNINQELTRQNIVKLRKEHGYTQAKVAELMGGSRTIYNGIENGKVKITEYYVQTLADVYGVGFESIAVFASGYDEGFYQGMQTKLKLDDSQFDSDSMKVYHMGKELLTGKKYKSTLYPALKAMGYRIEVVDIKDLDDNNIPKTVKEQVTDNKLFVLIKGLKNVCYLAPSQFYNFESFLNIAINGFLSEIKAEQKKAEGIRYTFNTPLTSKRRSAPSKASRFKNAKGYKIASPQDKRSAEQQMKEIQEELRTRGIQESEDEGGDDN